MNRFLIQIGRYTLEYDAAYGVHKRRGWCVCTSGGYDAQFVSFWTALKVLGREWWRGEPKD